MGLDDYMKYLNDRDSSQHRQSVINVLKNRAFLSQFMRSVIDLLLSFSLFDEI